MNGKPKPPDKIHSPIVLRIVLGTIMVFITAAVITLFGLIGYITISKLGWAALHLLWLIPLCGVGYLVGSKAIEPDLTLKEVIRSDTYHIKEKMKKG